jgi:hypothetical protein
VPPLGTSVFLRETGRRRDSFSLTQRSHYGYIKMSKSGEETAMGRQAALASKEQETETHERVARAIGQRSLLRVDYQQGSLVVEPHAYGCIKNGVRLLYCYHVPSDSAMEEGEGWKLLRVDDIVDACSLPQHFASLRPGYKSGLAALRMKLYCNV